MPMYEYRQFAAARRQQGNLAISPAGDEVAYIVDTSGQLNVWRQSVTGGWPYQVTLFSDWAARTVAWSPTGEQLAVAADREGNEQFQLGLIPARGGQVTFITDRQDVQHHLSPHSFSPDGGLLAYASNELDPARIDLFVYDLGAGQSRPLVTDAGVVFVAGWSPDGSHVLAQRFRSLSDIDLLLVDVSTGEYEIVGGGEAAYRAAGPWLADGSGFYVITDAGREFKGAALTTVADGKSEWVLTPEWDVEAIALGADAGTLMWSVNDNGTSAVVVQQQGGDPEPIRDLPAGVLGDLVVAPDGGRAVVRLDCAISGTDLYSIDLRSRTVEQITFNMLGGIPSARLVHPEQIRYPTWDGRDIPAFLYRPAVEPGASVPVVLSIHGGPQVQERAGYAYAGLYQYLAYQGIAVLAPNTRGSSGYGKSYQALIDHDWGGGDLRDLEHAALWLQRQPWVDGDRLAVFGPSYGGFAALSCLTRLSQYWAAGVDVLGPSNLLTFVQSCPPMFREYFSRAVGDPDLEAEFLMERSPATYVDRLRCPLLVIQGANDYRVPRSESDTMVEAIRARGGQVEYLVFPDEGHGFTRPENLETACERIAQFFVRHLGIEA